jgi:hypothetical protein
MMLRWAKIDAQALTNHPMPAQGVESRFNQSGAGSFIHEKTDGGQKTAIRHLRIGKLGHRAIWERLPPRF